MKTTKIFKIAITCAALLSLGSAQAASVDCGNNLLGVRIVTIDPGLVGGYCYAQVGNLQNTDITGLGLNLIEKDVVADGAGPATSGNLTYTIGGNQFGTWAINASLWNSWEHLYLGFHFGGGGNTTPDNPDSFIVELARPNTSGTWALGGLNAQLNGLSNIYLISKTPCTTNCGGGGGGGGAPEPASLALAGLALAAAAAVRRRRQL